MAGHSSQNSPPLSDHEFRLSNHMADTIQSLVSIMSVAASETQDWSWFASIASTVSSPVECDLRGGRIITTTGRHVYQGLPQTVLGILPESRNAPPDWRSIISMSRWSRFSSYLGQISDILCRSASSHSLQSACLPLPTSIYWFRSIKWSIGVLKISSSAPCSELSPRWFRLTVGWNEGDSGFVRTGIMAASGWGGPGIIERRTDSEILVCRGDNWNANVNKTTSKYPLCIRIYFPSNREEYAFKKNPPWTDTYF